MAKPRDPLDDPNLWRQMTCLVCVTCFQNMEWWRKYGEVRCYFGGPFSGYTRVP